MKWTRIWAITLRHLIALPQDFNQWTSLLFWPILDIALFGFAGVWMHTNSDGNLAMLLAGVTLWQFFVRINFDISLSLLEEVWAHNTINLFATPLSISEWFCGVLLKGFLLGGGMLVYTAAFVYWAYAYNIFTLGLFLLFICLQLALSGIIFGLLGAGLLVLWGPRVQTLVFILGFIAAPLSGAFYPVSVLPDWLQTTAYAFPFVYIFRSLYTYILTHTWPLIDILYMTLYNGILLGAALAWFAWCFRISKQKGLERLVD